MVANRLTLCVDRVVPYRGRDLDSVTYCIGKSDGTALLGGTWPPSLDADSRRPVARKRRASARQARRARGQHIGRPKALDEKKAALAQRMHANGESASTIAATLNVSRATIYRVLAEQNDDAVG